MSANEEMARQIGKIIDRNDFKSVQRDAIHVAIAPVRATEVLSPSQDIGFVFGKRDITNVGIVDHPIGIVDPFLKQDVKIGQEFLMWLYPNSITDMQHSWVHPAFDGEYLKVDNPIKLGVEYVASREWLEDFATENGGMDFEELLVAAEDWVATGESIIDGGRWESCYVPDEFWGHFENVTDQKVKEKDRGSFFSCSC